MRKEYNPEDLQLWLQYYNGQATQTGYGLPGFRGSPYQRGAGLGSFFRSLFRMAVPVLKTVGKKVGQQALASGANIASDLLQGRSVGEALEEHGKAGASKLLRQAGDALGGQKGSGLGTRFSVANTTKRIKAPKNASNDIFESKTKRKNGSTRRQQRTQY